MSATMFGPLRDTHPNPSAATPDEVLSWDRFGPAVPTVKGCDPSIVDHVAAGTFTHGPTGSTVPTWDVEPDSISTTWAIRWNQYRTHAPTRATFDGSRWVSGGKAMTLVPVDTDPMDGLASVVPDGMGTVGTGFEPWDDDATRADEPEHKNRGERVTWCDACQWVEGVTPVHPRDQRRQDACTHEGARGFTHEYKAAQTGRTAFATVVPGGSDPDERPSRWERRATYGPPNPSGKGAYTRNVLSGPRWVSVRGSDGRDHGSRVRRFNVPTGDGPVPFGTATHPDMAATSASRSLIGTGAWPVRTGESARHATPDRGAIRWGLDVVTLVPTDGTLVPVDVLSSVVHWGSDRLTKGGRVSGHAVKARKRRTAVAKVTDAVRSGTVPAPTSARAMRRRVADAMRAERERTDQRLTY